MSKTMIQVNKDRATRPDDLVASGSVVEMRYQDDAAALSLRSGKMLHLLVKAANSALGEAKEHRIRLSELKEKSRVNSNEIADIALELVRTAIIVSMTRPEKRTVMGPILNHAEIDHSENGFLVFSFSKTMLSVFNADDRWTILARNIVMKFKSRYSLRLYEMLSLRCGFGRQTETFDIADLRARLGVERDTLKTFTHFRARCLDPAVEEVRRVVGMGVERELVLSGQTVTGVKLSWSAPMSTPVEDETPARRRGRPAGVSTARDAADTKATKSAVNAAVPSAAAAVERTPAQKAKGFPAKGGISYSAWGELSRKHAPGWDPDLIAAAFRDFAVKKGLPLNAAETEKAFVGFCKTKVKPA